MVHGFLTMDLFPHAPLARLVKLGPIFFYLHILCPAKMM